MWSAKKIQELEQRGFKVIDSGSNAYKRIQIPAMRKNSSQKDWIAKNLWVWCKEKNLLLEHEVRFDKDRRWRFDFAIRSLKIGIEYEGMMSEKSRHTTVVGFTEDAEKYNSAQLQGWKVLRFTALNYRNVLTALNKLA